MLGDSIKIVDIEGSAGVEQELDKIDFEGGLQRINERAKNKKVIDIEGLQAEQGMASKVGVKWNSR